MANNVRHFAINADDLDRARRFYERVFGWRIEPWGPPGFFQITTGSEQEPGIRGALQGRRELVPGKRMIGFECSIGVDDVDQIAAAVRANGGRVIMERTTIVGVGHLVFFADPEGNVAGAMQYDPQAE
ncbi:MAG TPA: VOC family protein [Thermoanaerobaculia bacterium]|nr:VOC family protein [Thermoanaerobaculia bacterium]